MLWHTGEPYTSTFSIVAHDAPSRSWGVAVQSAFLAAGCVVPWARAGVGAVATQALSNPRFGPLGLAMLAEGMPADEVLAALIAGDGGRAMRQLAVVDGHGGSAAFTGDECLPWAGHVTRPGFTCQGNILAGPAVVDDMVRAFESNGELAFPERLIAVLEAAQAAGGDVRGQQAAAILVVRPHGGFGGYSDRVVDLRVDDHAAPITELARLLRLHRELFGV